MKVAEALNGVTDNELVMLGHMQLGGSKPQQEHTGTEGKRMLPCLATQTFHFF